MKKTCVVFAALAVACSTYFVDVKMNEQGKATIQATSEVNAFLRRVGRAISRGARRLGSAIKRGVRKVGSAIKKGVKKVGSAIKKGVQKVASGFKKFFNNIKNFAKNLKDKLIAKMKGFAKKIYDKVNGYIQGIVTKVVSKISDKLGFNIMELGQVIDKKTGKIDMDKIKAMILKKINEVVIPWLQDKARFLVDKGMSFIKPLLDGAASAIIGAVGTIPFAGGALASAVSVAYRMGMEKLMELATTGVSNLISKFVTSWFNKGFNFLVTKVKPIKNFLDRVISNAQKLIGWWKKAGEMVK